MAIKRLISRTAAGVVVLVVALAWCGLAFGAPKRVGNAGSDEAPAAAEAEKESTDAEPAEEPATGDWDAEESPTEAAGQPEELMDDAAKDDAAKQGDKPAAPNKAAKDGDGEPEAEPDAPAGPAIPPAVKPKEKKVRDFVGKADQKRDRKGLYRFESGAYDISTDVNKDLANIIAAHMDRVYLEYSSRLRGFRPNPYAAVKPNQKMPLYVIRRYRDYLTLMQERFGFNVANSGGVFFRSRNGSGLATWVEGQTRFKMFNVLQHEGFHQFANARIIGDVVLANGQIVEMPPWVNEGLAEYFGDAIMVKGELRIGRLDRERLRRMKDGIRQEVVLPFHDLMTLTNDQWVGRIIAGDKRSSLMYDNVWSICHFLIHGNKAQRAALENYLLKLNNDFVTDSGRDRRAEAFNQIFGNNLENFEKAWKLGVQKMEPDAWYTSVRHLEWMAAALQQFHKQEVKVKSWPHLKEQLIRHKVKALIRERDIVARGERMEAVEDEEQDLNFPDPAQARIIPSTDPKLPHGMLVTHIEPNLLLTWSINENGVLEQDISYLDPPRQQLVEIKKFKKEQELKKKQEKRQQKRGKPAGPTTKPAPGAKPELTAGPGSKKAAPGVKAKPATKNGAGEKRTKKGTIRVGS